MQLIVISYGNKMCPCFIKLFYLGLFVKIQSYRIFFPNKFMKKCFEDKVQWFTMELIYSILFYFLKKCEV